MRKKTTNIPATSTKYENPRNEGELGLAIIELTVAVTRGGQLRTRCLGGITDGPFAPADISGFSSD